MKTLKKGELSLQELKAVRDSLVNEKDRKLERLCLIAAGMFFLVLLVMVYMGVFAGWSTEDRVCLIFAVLFLLVVLYCAWFVFYKHQFNAALKKGYPGYYEDLKVKLFLS